MEIILKTLVGSRLHGLCNEKSDYDWRGIFKEGLIDIISPFRKQRSNSFIEGQEDDTSYELTHFCKLASQCNPTVLEVLWSHIIKEKDSSGISDALIDNRHKFLDSKRIYLAHLGYAENQVKKMNLYNPDMHRTPKTIVAYIRVMRQGEELIRTGEFDPVYNYLDRDFIMEVKYNFNEKLIPEISKKMYEVRTSLEETHAKFGGRFEVDTEWIENFLVETYVNDYQDERMD